MSSTGSSMAHNLGQKPPVKSVKSGYSGPLDPSRELHATITNHTHASTRFENRCMRQLTRQFIDLNL